MRRSHALASVFSATILIAASATTALAATSAPTPTPTASASTTSTVVLSVKTHDKRVPAHYTKFSYQTGKVSGIDPKAAKKINKTIAKDVHELVKPARHDKGDACIAGVKRCGYFALQLAAPTCTAGNVCITEPGQSLPPGANTGSAWVNTAVFDAATGKLKAFEEFVSPKQEDAFFKAANAAVTTALVKGGIDANDKTWKPDLSLKRIYAWTPQPDGMRVYFNKYDVAPGSFGVVEILVPWSAFQ